MKDGHLINEFQHWEATRKVSLDFRDVYMTKCDKNTYTSVAKQLTNMH